jgi:glycosyltransferase involved in cell wall biosynthesis
MKIAYVSIEPADDPNAWSGLNQSIADCLRRQNLEVNLVGPLYHSRRAFVSKVRSRLRQWPGGRRFLWTRDPSLLRAYGRDLARRLAALDCDVIFSPGTEAIAHLPASVRTPVVFWTDAPVAAMLDYYPWYSGLDPRAASEAMATDSRALHRATLACYSSEWAAGVAVTAHGAAPDKVAVLPFGPNLDSTVTEAEIAGLTRQRLQPPWRFLFVGVDWARKGGDHALAVVAELNRRGCPSELDVMGCAPPPDRAARRPFVRWHGFVDRRQADGRRRMAEAYRRATFFLLPSRAEAFGVVFCEAAAHGLPALAVRTGGIPAAVRDGAGGHLFAPDASVADWADRIQASALPVRHEEMSRAAHQDFAARLNWPAIGARLRTLLETTVNTKRPLALAS